ncbi:UNVERIFIED_ORG: N-acetylglucosaminyldiphosphoundecaprenol N-acetyl-beta-D-mannosaminyltransferase [Pseudomonas putida]|nr:N-acetylglucosaminyldiphosphoundecaprenol N-acetyl-beta-D-mannosaminyltransferase [Pseudomonas putida]
MRPFESSNNITIFGVKLSTLNMEETIEHLLSEDTNNSPIIREDLNAFKACLKKKNENVSKALESANIVNADGMSIVYAAKFLNGIRIPRVTGCDLFSRLISESHKRRKSIFLLGATEDVLRDLTLKLTDQYSDKLIAGSRNGYFQKTDWDKIIRNIDTSKADLLFIGTPSPQKEEFLNYAKVKIKRRIVIMGVGGSFDVLSGKVNRAPLWMQSYGLEWFFRLVQEPRRMWKRYLTTNSEFVLLMLQEKYKQLRSR